MHVPRLLGALSIAIVTIGSTTVTMIAVSAAPASNPVPSATADGPSPSPAPSTRPISTDDEAGPASSAPPPSSAAPPSGPEELRIEGFAFAPASSTVAVGTTLTWTNLDLAGHTVTSVDDRFSSPLLQHGETFELELDEPGTYPYFCAVHPTMTGTIEVVG